MDGRGILIEPTGYNGTNLPIYFDMDTFEFFNPQYEGIYDGPTNIFHGQRAGYYYSNNPDPYAGSNSLWHGGIAYDPVLDIRRRMDRRDIAMQALGYVPFQSMLFDGMGYDPGLERQYQYPMVGVMNAREERRNYQRDGGAFDGVPRNTTMPLCVRGCENEVW